MNIIQLLCIITVVLSMVAGQILFKYAAQKLITENGLLILVRSLASWEFLLALLFYAVSTLLWVFVLKTTALSKAYPFNALAFVLVPLLSFFLFGDPINKQYLLGSALLLGGIVLVTTS